MPTKQLLGLIGIVLVAGYAWAHETQSVTAANESYDVIVGYSTEPPFTEERNGLDLFVRQSESGEPVENMQNSLSAVLVAPDGESTLDLELRARHGRPGAYTDDFLLTEPGFYTLRITGFIGAVEVDLTFELHEVRHLDELRFP